MKVNPILLEVFKNRFSSISEEMGVTLTRTAFSPNIKERRDCSCAVFDHEGEMIAQAAHIPVLLMADLTDMGMDPRCTGMWAAWAIISPS